ncbi:MAG TPA: restriction endonuclease, partial [Caldimonas sp.]|nr:restriction endonuclease [Caldimonas sp.]
VMAWKAGPAGQGPVLDLGERTSRGPIVEAALKQASRPVRPQAARSRPKSIDRRAATEIASAPKNVVRDEPPEHWCAEVFDAIEWRRFESVVEALFAQAGFETRSQPSGADGGIDIWLHSRALGGRLVSLVQCKHWSSWKVGVKPVRELRGVMGAHRIARGQFVTTSRYTADARLFARDNGIMLHDTRSLLELIASRSDEEQQALLRVAFFGEYWRPTCASCGVKLVERQAHDGSREPFWGCRNYPRCRRTLPMRPMPTS